LLGVGIGIIGARVVPQITDARVIVSVPSAVIAVVLAIAIGIVFGVYPASRAARLAPIDALRSE
jgi:putative ABC transport system permease protein